MKNEEKQLKKNKPQQKQKIWGMDEEEKWFNKKKSKKETITLQFVKKFHKPASLKKRKKKQQKNIAFVSPHKLFQFQSLNFFLFLFRSLFFLFLTTLSETTCIQLHDVNAVIEAPLLD